MKDTITAKQGYRVRKVINAENGAEGYKVLDGDNLLLIGYKRSVADFKEEQEERDEFTQWEVFTTTKGNQFIYWYDEILDEDYVAPVKE
jgi:hypothetical protein